MPTKRIPISRFSTALNAAQLAFLHGSLLPDDVGPVEFVEYAVLTAGHRAADDMPLQGRPNARQLWEEHGAAVLAVWIGAKPGTRPPAWWKVAAPEPRLRLGGIGEPWTLRDVWRGVPAIWSRPVRGDFQGARELSYDPEDPPIFEAEAAYLKRLGLLGRGELRRLVPADFRPQPIATILGLGKGAVEPADAL